MTRLNTIYNIILSISLLLGAHSLAPAQAVKISREDYIAKYKELAQKQMQLSGIPASIIMGQACFESDNGNSRLATEANNHFGIKCNNSWKGPSIRHDDDALQECFRKYDSPEGSFADHSDFLRYRDRYAFLFELPATDYKAWAYGLKKAGYATNPAYAERLIKIIEDNKLYELDRAETVTVEAPAIIEQEQTTKIDIDNYTITVGRQQYRRNGVKYVLALHNDTFEAIAIDLDMKAKKLQQYNDAPSLHTPLQAGELVYIEAKEARTVATLPLHIAEAGETMRSIAQRYAVQLKRLYKYNGMKAGQEPVAGQEIFLREPKKR